MSDRPDLDTGPDGNPVYIRLARIGTKRRQEAQAMEWITGISTAIDYMEGRARGFLLLFCYTLVVILIKENPDK